MKGWIQYNYWCITITRIRRFFTPTVVKTIATSLIGSKLDYCNSFLFNVTEKEISKLQGVQNCLARVVTKSPRFCHITPLLKALHWLPVRYRIKFKLCSLTCQALTSGQPVYIRNMLQPLRKVRTLRSSDLDQLNVPRVRAAVGSRAFSVAAPRLWNKLPLEIRSAKTRISFRKKLKTYFLVRLFRLKSSVVRLARTTNANGFWNYESDHRGFRRYRSLLLLLL